ncbi:MAG: hypothetical protein OEV43_05025 [Coriobacteriia bacterium]|nr:hypothetical protein [Coriobacteriia bacterium]
MDVFETFRFLLALALTPLVIVIGRKIEMKRAYLPFLVGYVAIVVSFAASAPRGWPDGSQLLRFVGHASFVVGGLGMAWAALVVRQYALESNGTDK